MFIPTLAGQGTVEQVYMCLYLFLYLYIYLCICLNILCYIHSIHSCRWVKYWGRHGSWGWLGLMHRCLSSSSSSPSSSLSHSFPYLKISSSYSFKILTDWAGPWFLHPGTWTGGNLPWTRSTVWAPLSHPHLLQGGHHVTICTWYLRWQIWYLVVTSHPSSHPHKSNTKTNANACKYKKKTIVSPHSGGQGSGAHILATHIHTQRQIQILILRPRFGLGPQKKTSPQAKRHKSSLLFTSLTILTFITR